MYLFLILTAAHIHYWFLINNAHVVNTVGDGCDSEFSNVWHRQWLWVMLSIIDSVLPCRGLLSELFFLKIELMRHLLYYNKNMWISELQLCLIAVRIRTQWSVNLPLIRSPTTFKLTSSCLAVGSKAQIFLTKCLLTYCEQENNSYGSTSKWK